MIAELSKVVRRCYGNVSRVDGSWRTVIPKRLVRSLLASGVVDHESTYELLWTFFSDGQIVVKFLPKA